MLKRRMIVIDPVEDVRQAIITFLEKERLTWLEMIKHPDKIIAERLKPQIDQIDEAIAHLQTGAVSRAIILLEQQRLLAAEIDLETAKNDVVAKDFSLRKANRKILDLLDEWLKILRKQVQS